MTAEPAAQTKRPRKSYTRNEPEVVIGGRDSMSRLAGVAQVPLCQGNPLHDATVRCTRARGHDEDKSTKHVATVRGVVTAIWEA